jgi:hypothetical protein
VLRTTNQYWGYSAKDGTSLWNLTITYPVAGNEAFYLQGVQDFVVFNPVDATFHCYSDLTGASLWTSPSFSSSPWTSEWDVYSTETNDYNNLYIAFPDGTMAALSLTTGQIVWHNFETANSTEYTNNVVPFYSGIVMAGGNIYAYAAYSPIYELDPVPRQAMLVCVNATTGNVTYTLNGAVYPYAAADGYIVGLGRFDGNLYCVGKGQTSTSVVIQNDVVANGATALIKGNVLDQSPAQPGTPAVSDASMSEQMDYLHMQNSTLLNNPPKESGVPVTLTAVDPNGNALTIGSTTTDSAGNYALNFVPDKTGIYTITATFAGTDSYWPSTSETTLSVTSPAATPSTTSAPANLATTSDIMTYIVAVGIAIILAVAIATILILRKK